MKKCHLKIKDRFDPDCSCDYCQLLKDIISQYQLNDSDKNRIKYHRKRAIKKGLKPENSFTESDLQTIKIKSRFRCFWCGANISEMYHIDHIIPLSKGGNNEPSNICLSCEKCNFSKGFLMPFNFIHGYKNTEQLSRIGVLAKKRKAKNRLEKLKDIIKRQNGKPLKRKEYAKILRVSTETIRRYFHILSDED